MGSCDGHVFESFEHVCSTQQIEDDEIPCANTINGTDQLTSDAEVIWCTDFSAKLFKSVDVQCSDSTLHCPKPNSHLLTTLRLHHNGGPVAVRCFSMRAGHV